MLLKLLYRLFKGRRKPLKAEMIEDMPPLNIPAQDDDLRFRIGTVIATQIGSQPIPSGNDAIVQLIGFEEFSGKNIDLFARARQEGLNISKAWKMKDFKAIRRSAGIIREIVQLPLPAFPIQMFFDTGAIEVCVTILQSSGAENADIQTVALKLLSAIFKRGCTMAQGSLVVPILVDLIRSRLHDESASENVVLACNVLVGMAMTESDDDNIRDVLLETPGLISLVANGMMNHALKHTCRAALAELSTAMLCPPFDADLEVVRPLIQACNHCVLGQGEDADVFRNSLESLGYCVHMRDERMVEAVNPPDRMLPFLCNFIKSSPNHAGVSDALKILSHVAGGTDEQTEGTLKAGVVDVLPIGLQNGKLDDVFYSLMAVRNIGSGNESQKRLITEAAEVIQACFRAYDRFGEEDVGVVEQVVQIIGNIVLGASRSPGEMDRRVEQYPLVQYSLLAMTSSHESIMLTALEVLSMILQGARVSSCVRGGRSNPFSAENWERVKYAGLLPDLVDMHSTDPQHFFAPVVCDFVWYYLAMGLSDRILKEDGTPLFSRETNDAKTWNRIVALRVITLLTGVASFNRVSPARVWLGKDLWFRLWSFYFV